MTRKKNLKSDFPKIYAGQIIRIGSAVIKNTFFQLKANRSIANPFMGRIPLPLGDPLHTNELHQIGLVKCVHLGPFCGQTDMTENITCPRTRYLADNIHYMIDYY